MVKKTALSEYVGTKKSKGIGAINVKEEDELSVVTLIKDEPIVIVTKKGYAIKFNAEDITPMGRIAMGVKGINLGENDEVIAGLPVRHSEDNLAIFSDNGYGKRVELSEIPLQKRGGKGVIVYKESTIAGQASAA